VGGDGYVQLGDRPDAGTTGIVMAARAPSLVRRTI